MITILPCRESKIMKTVIIIITINLSLSLSQIHNGIGGSIVFGLLLVLLIRRWSVLV